MAEQPFDFGPLESEHIADPEVLGPDCYACPSGTPWPCDVVRLIRAAKALRSALMRSDSRLSLLMSRAPIPWGGIGIGQRHEYEEVIGQSRAALRESEGLTDDRP